MLQILTTTYAVLFGLCLGSFANVLIYRLPRGESIITPPSHCPSCGVRLTARDLIPVLSWLFLRGQCRFCHERISRRYPLVEAACAVLFAAMSFYTGAALAVVPLCLLAFMLLCVSMIDFDTQEIPNGLLIFGGLIGLAWVAVTYFYPIGAPTPRDALLGALCGAMPLFLIDQLCLLLVKKNGFGFGDVKLMAVVGLFIGWQGALVSLFFAFVMGGIFATFLLATKREEQGAYMAFGPFLSAGVLAAVWFGQAFIKMMMAGGWYGV